MSAIRIPGPDGRTILRIIDDGASPSRSSKGLKGATFDNPIQVERITGESERARLNRQTREYKAREAAK